jgi:hypothetical protein
LSLLNTGFPTDIYDSKDKSGENIMILLTLSKNIIQNIWHKENSEAESKKSGTVFFKGRNFKRHHHGR